jgi:hypothetical protein
MAANGPTSTSVYPTEDDEGNPVGLLVAGRETIEAELQIAHYRVRVFDLQRPPDN